MNRFYRNTLTGYIMGFLDYFLKSYLNGSYFKEDFLI